MNAIVLEVFGPEDLLGLPDFVTAHVRAVTRRARRVERRLRPDPDPLAYEAAGVFAGHCVRLRLVAVEGGPGGARRLRLLDREMQFAREGRKVVRVRGLTPAELDRNCRRARAAARRGETFDRKARDAATPVIGGLINALVDLDRHAAVPMHWHTAGFLPADLVGRGVAESVDFIVAYHQEAAFDRERLRGWEACLGRSVKQAAERSRSMRNPASHGPDPEAADIDALMRLTRADDA